MTKKLCAVLEIDSHRLKSDIINNDSQNCNFSNYKLISQTMTTSFDKGFNATMNFVLYSSSSYGRTVFYGSQAMKNSRKFLIHWVPKNYRENSLKSATLIQSTHLMSSVPGSKSKRYVDLISYSNSKLLF